MANMGTKALSITQKPIETTSLKDGGAPIIITRRLLFDTVVCLIPARRLLCRYHKKIRDVRLIAATLWPLTKSFESRLPKTLKSRYRPSPYYPICIGDILAHRYRIEHKLGPGCFSTVWVARDILKGKDVALKIMVSGI